MTALGTAVVDVRESALAAPITGGVVLLLWWLLRR